MKNVTQPRKTRWPWIIGCLMAFAALAIIDQNTMNSEERYRRSLWESTVPPCIFNPDTGAPVGLPCRSGDTIYTK
jgi:hypothetical protein